MDRLQDELNDLYVDDDNVLEELKKLTPEQLEYMKKHFKRS